ncbi:MAG: UDP-3-O-(3-hydroxymyristoyl)glucosamine N-acyltransferase [Lentisphaerae bacterium GWF2_52_8]|nr:MAG: UDP-3-O-(3-hydroxymyristoyl)glucosamine N-acyltransferase [Lentisphaerae bacterium GWF2_52_8]
MDKNLSSQELATLAGGTLAGAPDISINGVAALKQAGPSQASFLGNKKYKNQVAESQSGVVLVPKDYDDAPPEGRALVICEDPNLAFSKIIDFFAPPPVNFAPGIHAAAVVHASAKLGANVHIGACAVIEEGAEIGANTVIAAGSYLGHFAKVGENCLIYANVTIRERCVLGSRVILHPGVVIGGDGFGFAPGPRGIVKIPQVGIVQIDDDVEIGANSTIDRARFGKTWIKRGVKIDNLVQVAHNAVVGDFSMLVAQCGVAGSAELGRGVIMGAQSGINGHITIGDGVKVAGTSGVVKSVPAGSVMLGTPAEGEREFMERYTLPKKMRKLSDKIAALERELLALKTAQAAK